MSARRHQRLWGVGGIAIYVASAGFGCRTEASANPDGGQQIDAAIDMRSDGDAGEPWDPVWHKTEPAQWPTVGPEGQPDCGPGCRIALNLPVSHPSYPGYGHDTRRVADTNVTNLYYAEVGSSTTHVVATREAQGPGFVQPYVDKAYLTYLASNYPDGVVELMSLETGEKKAVYSFTQAQNDLGVGFTALNSKFAFWWRYGQGLMSRNLQTGEVRVLSPGWFSCYTHCTTATGLICGDVERGRIIHIDQESGEVTALNNGGAMQVDSNCSPDRRRVVWVDYRDPPGTDSTYDFHRSGGEVYMKDLNTNETRRLTFDSPDNPRGKLVPAVDGDTVMWKEPCPSCDPNPETLQALMASTTTVVRLDLTTGERCRTERRIGWPSLQGRHLYAYWLDSDANETRLVDIDMDDPALEWTCE